MSNPPQGLYTARELLEGFSPTDDLGFTLTHDFAVFRSFVMNGGAVPSTLTVRRDQAEHDASIGDGLRRFLKAQKKPLVGIMGGHSVARGSEAYVDIAKLASHLSERYLIVTGGGPGVMEAAHVGVAFSTSPAQTLKDALDRLALNPVFPGLDGVLTDNGDIADGMHDALKLARDWLQAALEARAMAPEDVPVSLAIPTWLYGAEPTMPFATHYGKYFQNSIREEALISNSRAGIIYGQGGGGRPEALSRMKRVWMRRRPDRSIRCHELRYAQPWPTIRLSLAPMETTIGAGFRLARRNAPSPCSVSETR